MKEVLQFKNQDIKGYLNLFNNQKISNKKNSI